MRVRATISVAVTLIAAASAQAEMIMVDVGTFQNSGLGEIDYAGDFAGFVSGSVVDGKTQADIDLGGIMSQLDGLVLEGIRIIDTGANQYGENSSGADIDLLSLTGLAAGIDLAFSYLGPTSTHQSESSEDLAARVAAIDAQSGAHEWSGMFHVSLGEMGMLTAMLSSPVGGTEAALPPLAGAGLGLHVAEAGFGESYRVQMLMSVPTPGAIPLLGLAALAGRSRRRRSPAPA